MGNGKRRQKHTKKRNASSMVVMITVGAKDFMAAFVSNKEINSKPEAGTSTSYVTELRTTTKT